MPRASRGLYSENLNSESKSPGYRRRSVVLAPLPSWSTLACADPFSQPSTVTLPFAIRRPPRRSPHSRPFASTVSTRSSSPYTTPSAAAGRSTEEPGGGRSAAAVQRRLPGVPQWRVGQSGGMLVGPAVGDSGPVESASRCLRCWHVCARRRRNDNNPQVIAHSGGSKPMVVCDKPPRGAGPGGVFRFGQFPNNSCRRRTVLHPRPKP